MPFVEKSIRVQAMILAHYNYGESDRFVRMLTPDRGKISVLARGVRKMNSRKAGHLEPFTVVSAQLVQGRGSAWTIQQVETQEAYPDLARNLETTCFAAYVAELADRFSDEDTESRDLFNLVVRTIRRLHSDEDPYPALRLFDFRLLDLTGYRPQLQDCVGCGEAIQPQAQYFSLSFGGALCPNCAALDFHALPISTRTLKFFRYYQARSITDAGVVPWPGELRAESDHILNAYFTHILERKINSREFLEKVG